MKFKLPKIYIAYGALLILLAAFVAFCLMRIFASFRIANEIDNKFMESASPRLSQDNLNKAIDNIESKKNISLD